MWSRKRVFFRVQVNHGKALNVYADGIAAVAIRQQETEQPFIFQQDTY